MRQMEDHSGFSAVEVLVVLTVVAVLAATGLVQYQHHKSTSAKSSTGTRPQSTEYLTIYEWGVKIPLSSAISDAYYTSIFASSQGSDGEPNQFSLGLKSLDSSGCAAANGAAPVLLFRTSPTKIDPVSNKPVSKEGPGVTIGNYFYGYSLTKSKTCDSPTTFQHLDSAMTTAAKGIVPATN